MRSYREIWPNAYQANIVAYTRKNKYLTKKGSMPTLFEKGMIIQGHVTMEVLILNRF